MNKDAIYHACRIAFNAGQDKIPWHLTLHALREGLNYDEFKTHTLTEKELTQHPELRNLILNLKESLLTEPRHVGTWVAAATPEGEIIKWGIDGDTLYPYPPDDKEAIKQIKFLAEQECHKNDRLYMVYVFNTGQMKHMEWDR